MLIVTGGGAPATAVSGSFRPWPVIVHTTVAPAATCPAARAASSPATPAADAGSPKTPSRCARSRYAARIWSSVTEAMKPPDSARASSASCQEAGLPTRIAVATVTGSSTGFPSTIGAAPAACEILPVAEPVGRDVTCVADRQAVHIGCVAERIDNLERRGLLALKPLGVDRVHERDRVVGGQLTNQLKAVVEVPVDLKQPGALCQSLRQLADRYVALGHQDGAVEARPGGIRGRTGARVTS